MANEVLAEFRRPKLDHTFVCHRHDHVLQRRVGLPVNGRLMPPHGVDGEDETRFTPALNGQRRVRDQSHDRLFAAVDVRIRVSGVSYNRTSANLQSGRALYR